MNTAIITQGTEAAGRDIGAKRAARRGGEEGEGFDSVDHAVMPWSPVPPVAENDLASKATAKNNRKVISLTRGAKSGKWNH